MGIAINDNNLFTSFQSFPQLLFCQLDFGFDVDEEEKRNLFNKVIFFCSICFRISLSVPKI